MDPSVFKFTGIHHLALATRNLGATILFWRDLVGLPLFLGFGRKGYRQYFFSISETTALAFFEWSEVEALEEKDHGVPVKGPFGFDHVSIGMESDADLARMKARLEAAGIWVSEAVDHGFIHSIYTFDPNHIAVEFSVPVKDVDLRAHPVLAEKNPPPQVAEGPLPLHHRFPDPENIPELVLYPGEGKDVLGG
ncbi:VOC family protein [Desulfobotulus sp.]|jgi:catechol 2,3-dioxygenase-like lactoylglutathione lyase family enzyme|uniref:VOC family protein n=1 Tax=Desulfobotulus sp. TaxID=1940337 RepID=UPI002A36D8CC|nr:VOC family protein [Desulfobotulus sp.]MDY0163829.1 VOC family protein [Desulfobotulus sp.]